MEDFKIKTHGLELFLIGVGVFIGLIALSILAYHIFIMDRVKTSVEYATASHFAANSNSVAEELSSPIQSISLDDISVTDKGSQGHSLVSFNLHLENGDVEKLKVGLVKVSDFWVIYSAVLNPDMPHNTVFVSTYQKIMYLLERVDFKDIDAARGLMEHIKKELADPFLVSFLDAKVNNASGFYVRAAQELDEIKGQLHFSKLAIKQEKALVFMAQQDWKKAIENFLDIEEIYDNEFDDLSPEQRQMQFSLTAKDPLSALLDIDSVLGSSRVLLATCYLTLQKYDQALMWSEKALDHATVINSDVLIRKAMLTKGRSYFELHKYDEAEKLFDKLLSDSTTNLRQLAWIYYFKANIASFSKRDEDALDYFEIAINLDPENSEIRKKAIQYLLYRNYFGDLEVALAFALRGMNYEVDRQLFKDMASLIYDKLGLVSLKSRLN